jgi:hypothetical protein
VGVGVSFLHRKADRRKKTAFTSILGEDGSLSNVGVNVKLRKEKSRFCSMSHYVTLNDGIHGLVFACS